MDATSGRYVLLMIYAYLFWLAGKRVNYALVHVENKFDVARTLGGALMCLTVPLATYQVRVGFELLASSLLLTVPRPLLLTVPCQARVVVGDGCRWVFT